MAQTARASTRSASAGSTPTRKARKEAKELVGEARRLLARGRKRVSPEKREAVTAAVAEVRAALAKKPRGAPADPRQAERLAAASKRLEELVDKHLGSLRRSPSVEHTLSIAKALAVALLLRLFVVEPFKIPSGSMIPTLLIGDHIFVNKLSYGVRLPLVNKEIVHWGGYQRGDIIVFVTPQDAELPAIQQRDFIKRIVGLPGDRVELRGETLFVNGEPQPRELVESSYRYFDRAGDDGPWFETEGQLWRETLKDPSGAERVHAVIRDPLRVHPGVEGPFQVPEGHLFVMGDNRDNSADGRFGSWYVPFGNVKGRALITWLSWGKPGFWFWGDGVGLRFERFFRTLR